MSADNYIFIDTKYRVWDCVASRAFPVKKDGTYLSKDLLKQRSRLVKRCKSLQEACDVADELDSEYGISFELWCK